MSGLGVLAPIYSNHPLPLRHYRDEQGAIGLWQSLPEAYLEATTYTDHWGAYRATFYDDKLRQVGKESGQTNHIERFNNTLLENPVLRPILGYPDLDTGRRLARPIFQVGLAVLAKGVYKVYPDFTRAVDQTLERMDPEGVVVDTRG